MEEESCGWTSGFINSQGSGARRRVGQGARTNTSGKGDHGRVILSWLIEGHVVKSGLQD